MMVVFGVFTDTFRESWEDVTNAFWHKYPNPLSEHVLSVDTVERFVDPKTGCMHSTRLLKKTNRKPQWMTRFFGDSFAYIVEKSVLDPREKTLTTFTQNITLTKFMTVEEKCIYHVADENPGWTTCETRARISSGLAIGKYVEAFGIDRFRANSGKAKQAILHVLAGLKQSRLTHCSSDDARGGSTNV